MTIEVRQATAADNATIVEFNRLLALESEGKTLDPEVLRRGVAAVLNDKAKGLYFLAEENLHPLGQIGVTYEWSDWRDGWFWWIQSVFVVPAARRRGVFRQIIEHIRQAARADSQVIGVRLYVDKGNAAAHATYLKMGLEWTSYQMMEQYPLA